MRPTVIINVPDSSASMQEEIFGPVVCVSSFHTEEEVRNLWPSGLCFILPD